MIALRLVTIEDAPAIRDLLAPLVVDGHVNFATEPATVDEMRERIVAAREKWPWIAAVDSSGAFLGYAFARPVSTLPGEQWTVEVGIGLADTARGQQLGTRLYRALLALLAEQGYRTALAYIVRPNAASEALHTRHGFRRIGVVERAGWKHGRWHDASHWQRHLVDPENASPPHPIKAVSEVAHLLEGS